jgi:hypothetical protein
MTEVNSVNGKTGAVVLAATSVEAVPASEVGQPGGVATLDSGGLLPKAQLPSAAVTSSSVALGEVSGLVKVDLSAGTVFIATLGGATEFEIVNAPVRPFEFVLYVSQNATGGWSWSVKDLSWIGSEPVFKTTAALRYRLDIESLASGAELLASAGFEGPKGETGATGATGPTGAKGESGTSSPSLMPIFIPVVAGGFPLPAASSAPATANRGFFARAICPKTGKLKALMVWNASTVAGNTRLAIFDTGNATEGKYTLIAQSAAEAMTGESKWQEFPIPAEPEVIAGTEYNFAMMTSSTTATFGTCLAAISGSPYELPEKWLPVAGKALPKLAGAHTFSELAFSTIAEANLEGNATRAFFVAARVE